MADPPIIFDDEARGKYLEDFAKTNQKLGAAKRLGVPLRVVRSTYDTDPEFKEAYDEAEELYNEAIVEEIHRRGVKGWDEPVFQQGALAGHITKYDSTLLLAEAKARLPEYNPKQKSEVTITGGVLLTAAIPMTTEAWIASGKPAAALPPQQEETLPPPPPPQPTPNTDVQELIDKADALEIEEEFDDGF